MVQLKLNSKLKDSNNGITVKNDRLQELHEA